MKFILNARDYSDRLEDYKELGEEVVEATSEAEAKIIYCQMKGINVNEFAKRDWDLLSGSYNYMWLD